MEGAMTNRALRDRCEEASLRFAEVAYRISVMSVFAFSFGLLLLALVGGAVALGAIEVPEFHPR
jgi:hypothetical protein